MLIVSSSFTGAVSQNAVGDRINARKGGTRSVVRALNGMVATSQPLASAAGLRILQQGGNAIDAAIAAAAVLCVVEPMMVSPGGDLFALVWDAKKKELKALNASGRAPKALSIDALKQRGFTRMPQHGIHTVTVPGAVDGWATLLKSHGTMTLAQVLQPAIEYAERGFPVTEIIATDWQEGVQHKGNADFAATFLPNGKALEAGELFTNKNLAATLKLIAKEGRDVMYKGALAEKIVKFAQAQGGLHTLADFANHTSNWVEPISTTYRGHTVYELPPNNQGLAALQMLNILEGFDVKALGHNTAEYLHLLVEAKKLAFLDRAKHIADPAFYQAPLAQLLSKDYAADLRKRIDLTHVASDSDGGPRGGEDTVYLTVVDNDRNAVSFIQSIFSAFGSGLVAGDTGIVLHNRGAGFSFNPQSNNRLEGGKRPFHTLIPGMVFKNSAPWLTFGVMGGDMQAQGHVQVLLNMIEFGMDVQQAGEQPRFRHFENGLALESAIGADVRKELEKRGHKLTTAFGAFGGYQAIMIDPVTGALAGGSDPRKDGCAIGW
ncbi:MAG: gamma-glutamyltransferase [Acidobacteria bacterium]|nr:gamma-glutamyltransferase [Acidobacteriota bacterium]MBI3423702.1 gamma-glutamyltransferase [Acidobacteriota bacterium]